MLSRVSSKKLQRSQEVSTLLIALENSHVFMILHLHTAQLSNSERRILCWSITVLVHYTVTDGVYIKVDMATLSNTVAILS